MESFIGERGYVDFSSGQWRDLDSYWRTDISAKVTYKENAWVGVSVENTFDEEYQEWPLVNNAPSRLYAFEAGYRF
jgi:outer membrane receptor protein involved in Fe transport